MRKGLPQLTGRGFLISKGVELAFSKNGQAYARLPLSFSHRVKNEDTDEWETKNEILVEAVAFGPLAEFLADNVPDGEHAELDVVGDIYTEDWEDKSGETRTSVKMTVHAASVAPKVGGAKSGGSKRQSSPAKRQADPWADTPLPSAPPVDPWGRNDDEPPF